MRESEFVFLGTHGKRLYSIKKPLANAIARAGIEKAHSARFPPLLGLLDEREGR